MQDNRERELFPCVVDYLKGRKKKALWFRVGFSLFMSYKVPDMKSTLEGR
jgi:hypothetical protein